MTSLMTPRPWQEDEQQYGSGSNAEPLASGIFSLHNAGWKAKQHGGARIKHLVAANGTLYAATDRGRVIRWVPQGGGEEMEIVIEKGGHDVIFKLHVDPSGSHLIVGGNQVLLHRPLARPRLPVTSGG